MNVNRRPRRIHRHQIKQDNQFANGKDITIKRRHKSDDGISRKLDDGTIQMTA